MATDPSASIHPTALVSPDAEIGPGASIGPFTIIEAHASIGPRCRIGARVSVKQGVTLGQENVIEEGAVLGGLPQHLERPESPGRLIIGDRNAIRENATIHVAMAAGAATRVGDDCLLMVGSHIAHDCVIGDRVILTNNVLLGGHVSVGSRAFIGGGAAVHQFCHIGRLAMVGGMARVAQDVPPFTMIDGQSGLVVGLNKVGLRRAEVPRGQVRDLKAAYQILYRSGLSLDEKLGALEAEFSAGAASELAPFLRRSSRSFVRERRTPPSATIRVHRESDDAAVKISEHRKAG